MIGMALKKAIVVKAWLEDFEANRSIYSGNSKDGWLMVSCSNLNTPTVPVMPVF